MNKFILKGKIALLMLVALLGATSCDDDDDDNQPALTNETFMQQAAASDMFEIQTGALAITKGTRTEVRELGQMLVTDHSLSSTELMALAMQKNTTLSTTLPADKATKVSRLQGLTGTAFDKEFAAMQVEAHEEAINLYERANNDISDASLQAFIDKILPKLEMHLDEAEDVKDLTD